MKTYFPKVTKMGSIISHRIDHNGVGVVVLRGAGQVVSSMKTRLVSSSTFEVMDSITVIFVLQEIGAFNEINIHTCILY